MTKTAMLSTSCTVPAGFIHLGCSYWSLLVALVDPLLDVVEAPNSNWRQSNDFE